MTDATRNPDDYCYRHPDRLSFVLCERCGRTICLECQNHVDGKVLCPDDAQARVTQIAEARIAREKARPRVRQTPRWLAWIKPETPIVSYVLMTILVLMFLVDSFVPTGILQYVAYLPGGEKTRPWTIVTSMFAEGGGFEGILSLLFSGFVIYFVGREFESRFGRVKFALLYAISGLGASVIALLFNGVVISAGSAVWGLIGAFFILLRRSGSRMLFFYISVGISALQIVLSDERAYLWQGALGGAVTGLAIGFVYHSDPDAQLKGRQRAILIGVVAVLAALIVVKELAT